MFVLHNRGLLNLTPVPLQIPAKRRTQSRVVQEFRSVALSVISSPVIFFLNLAGAR
jgi:hypothetical protein